MGSVQPVEPNLPAELSDEIIGWIGAFQNPWKDLSSCSLVCKAWLPASRSHLFHSAKVTLDKAPLWNAFLKSSHLTSYLRHIEILGRFDPDMPYETEIAQVNAMYELLPHLAQLTTVTSLCVDVQSWASLEDVHVTYLCSAFPNLTALELRTGKIRNNLQLMHILSHFSLLQRLSLVHMKVSAFDPIPEAHPRTLSPHLHTLKIAYGQRVLGKKDWLCASYPLAAVRHLELRDVPQGELASVGRLMRHLGDRLTTLVLSMDSFVDFGSAPTHLQPWHNSALERVHVMLAVRQPLLHRPPVSDAPTWTWLCAFLAAISAPLHTLELEADDSAAWLALDWVPFERALAGPQFALLSAFRVRLLLPAVAVEEAEMAVRARLPELETRGIVQVVTAVIPELEPTSSLYDVDESASLYGGTAN
ncbi:hypothetical protein C8R43DRAFT_6616 [Mycena crocata]|nr:hypothetical protein C8R43DRAFT_6616 [Mycena crocata]